MGNCTVYFAFQCTWTHKHFLVFSASPIYFLLLYFYSPFCSAPCFNNAPSSHRISAHTLGTFSAISPGICYGLTAPSSYFTNCFYLRDNVQLISSPPTCTTFHIVAPFLSTSFSARAESSPKFVP